MTPATPPNRPNPLHRSNRGEGASRCRGAVCGVRSDQDQPPNAIKCRFLCATPPAFLRPMTPAVTPGTRLTRGRQHGIVAPDTETRQCRAAHGPSPPSRTPPSRSFHTRTGCGRRRSAGGCGTSARGATRRQRWPATSRSATSCTPDASRGTPALSRWVDCATGSSTPSCARYAPGS